MLQTEAENTIRRRNRWRFSVPLLSFAFLFLAWWTAVIFYVAVDPEDVYPWGITPRLTSGEIHPEAVPYLVDVVAKDPAMDVIVIGGSTVVGFSRKLMREVFSTARNVFNLSYLGPRVGDRSIVSRQIARYSHARRIIVAVDWIYAAKGETQIADGFPTDLYDGNPFNDVSLIQKDTLRLALTNAGGKQIWLPDWAFSQYANARARRYRTFQSLSEAKVLERKIARYRTVVDAPTPLGCGDLDALNHHLVPFAQQMASRGVTVDLVFPPYSDVFYYDRLDAAKNQGGLGEALLARQVLLRRCVVRALGGVPGIDIYAFDNDDWLTGDLSHYSDSAHPYGADVYRYLLRSIADGSHRLTPQNIDAYLVTMQQRVKTYSVSNTTQEKSYARAL